MSDQAAFAAAQEGAAAAAAAGARGKKQQQQQEQQERGKGNPIGGNPLLNLAAATASVGEITGCAPLQAGALAAATMQLERLRVACEAAAVPGSGRAAGDAGEGLWRGPVLAARLLGLLLGERAGGDGDHRDALLEGEVVCACVRA